MFIRKHTAPLLALMVGSLLVACGGGDSETDPGAGGGGGTGTGAASLSWLPPTQNTDGSTVSLAGYRIYRGSTAGSLSLAATVANPGITSYVVENLASGTHYFAVSAYSAGGAESDRSPTASKTIP